MKYSREFKGKSLLEFPADYVVIDTETTDFDFLYGDIIEVAAYKYKNHTKIDEFTTLINPGYAIPAFIEKLTGIRTQDVQSAPSIYEIASDLNLFFENHILIGHNANFDINFLYDAFLKRGIKLDNNFVDTLRLSRILIKDIKNHRLKTLTKYFKISRPNHRSEADVIATHELYLKLLEINDLDPALFEEFLARRRKSSRAKDLTKITAQIDPDEIDTTHIFYGKSFCFTGRMDHMTKAVAAQIVANLGGTNQNNVTAKTDYLILGDQKHQKKQYGNKSKKHLKAEKMKQEDHHIEILTEISFLEIVNE